MNSPMDENEVILGVDTHLDTHVGVLINTNGNLLGCLAVTTDTSGYLRAPMLSAAPMPKTMPISTQPRFTKPSRKVNPRLKNATQPTNIAQTGRLSSKLEPAASAAVAAATAVNSVNINFDCPVRAVVLPGWLMIITPFKVEGAAQTRPPLTRRICPLTQAESGPAKKETTREMSSG